MKGFIETLLAEMDNRVIHNRGFVGMDDIVFFIRELQSHEYDAHVAIMGQNGSGKSMLMLMLLKKLNPNSINDHHLVFAHEPTAKLIRTLQQLKNDVIGIDEAKKFLHYKLSMTTEQIVLINMFEYARANKNAVITCTNDVRRLNNNYRNSKVQMVIWLLDRFDAGKKGYGIVFVGNPAIEEEDKFNMEMYRGIQSFAQIRALAQHSPNMQGYFLLDDARKILTEEEIRYYQQRKQEGIVRSALNYIQRLEKKEEKGKEEEKVEEKITLASLLGRRPL